MTSTVNKTVTHSNPPSQHDKTSTTQNVKPTSLQHLAELSADYFELNRHAYRIQTDAEAIQIAQQLAVSFAQDASQRDQARRLPIHELQQFSQSGLWGITIPKAFGGAEVSGRTLVEVVKTISSVDPSLGQLPQNHWVFLEHIALDASPQQQRFFFDLVLQGARLGNAFSEKHAKNVAQLTTTIRPHAQGFVIHGRKFFSTGALLAHWVPIVALNEDGLPFAAIVPRHTEGLNIHNDWSGFGQRTTASGSVELDQVIVRPEYVVPIHQAFSRPTIAGAVSQIIQAAVDVGIARGVIQETIDYVQQHSRPWIDSGLERASEDPYTIAAIGDLKIKLRAAEAVLDLAADQVDIGRKNPSLAEVNQASLLVAEAKVLSTELALLASNKLFELAGTRSTLAELNLDRHWRNARTHTLHDPVRWKYHIVGNYYLNGVQPPRHPWN